MCKRPCSKPPPKWKGSLDERGGEGVFLHLLCSVIYVQPSSFPNRAEILSWKKVWGSEWMDRKVRSRYRERACLQLMVELQAKVLEPSSSVFPALPVAAGSTFFPYISLQPRNALHICPNNKPITFILNYTNYSLPPLLFISYPTPHCHLSNPSKKANLITLFPCYKMISH